MREAFRDGFLAARLRRLRDSKSHAPAVLDGNMVDPGATPIDYDAVASTMEALAYPARLQLLDILRFPRTLSEIDLAPRRAQQHGRTATTAAMPTVQRHLKKLIEAGFVRTTPIEQEGRVRHSYSVEPQKLYAFTEELRRISTMHAGRGAGADATGTLQGAPAPSRGQGPRLVLVHGVYEGKSFALAGQGPWSIGRKKEHAVSLDYDPFVSSENAKLERRGTEFCVTDIPGSKNGTTLNWIALRRDEAVALEPGDILGVGRSLLCFRR